MLVQGEHEDSKKLKWTPMGLLEDLLDLSLW